MEAYLKVESCDQCPRSKAERVYTPDPFESVRKVSCTELNKVIHNYLDWQEKATIPKECPFIKTHMIWSQESVIPRN